MICILVLNWVQTSVESSGAMMSSTQPALSAVYFAKSSVLLSQSTINDEAKQS